jgi:pimeloyl-ACP methyl ester carboxylesterase
LSSPESKTDPEGFPEPPFRARGSRKRVVFLHGILGARLIDMTDGTKVWGSMMSMMTKLFDPVGWQKRLAQGDGLTNGGNIRPKGVIRLKPPFDTPLFNAYDMIESALKQVFGEEAVKIFTYDWRLRNEHSARRLLDVLKKRWGDAEENPEKRGTLVAHSMGGLVSRWCVEELGGWKYVDRVITFGTPHRGVAKTLDRAAFASEISDVVQSLGIHIFTSGGDNLIKRVVKTAMRWGSIVQMIPVYPFFYPSPTATEPEPIDVTIDRMQNDPMFDNLYGPPGAGQSMVRSQHFPSLRRLTTKLHENERTLEEFLTERDVHYVILGGDGHRTPIATRRTGDTSLETVFGNRGDGTVPLKAAVLPESSRVRVIVSKEMPAHQSLFQDEKALMDVLGVIRAGKRGQITKAKEKAADAKDADDADDTDDARE